MSRKINSNLNSTANKSFIILQTVLFLDIKSVLEIRLTSKYYNELLQSIFVLNNIAKQKKVKLNEVQPKSITPVSKIVKEESSGFFGFSLGSIGGSLSSLGSYFSTKQNNDLSKDKLNEILDKISVWEDVLDQIQNSLTLQITIKEYKKIITELKDENNRLQEIQTKAFYGNIYSKKKSLDLTKNESELIEIKNRYLKKEIEELEITKLKLKKEELEAKEKLEKTKESTFNNEITLHKLSRYIVNNFNLKNEQVHKNFISTKENNKVILIEKDYLRDLVEVENPLGYYFSDLINKK